MKRVGMMLLALLLLPFFAWADHDVAAEPDGRVNRALLVGCDRFVSQQDTSPSSANNVVAMARTLSGGTMALETLITCPGGVVTTGNLAALILDAFSEADEDDVSIFYISTHGVWQDGMSSAGMTLLLSDGVTESGVTARQLRSMFDQIRGTKVLLLDACHAGAMIGKGVNELLENVFTGPDYVVVCSSGGEEQSWFWSGEIGGEALLGEGYFSGSLVRGLSSAGGYGADDNHDGAITLTELRRYLLDAHGASTVRTYPRESDFVLLTYDASAHAGRSRDARVENVYFESDVLWAQESTISFSFNVVSRVQLAYQLVYHREGRWDFDGAELIYDNDGRFSHRPMAGRTLSPGYRERAIALDLTDEDSYGYVLLQMLAIDDGVPTVICSRVLCVTPSGGDPQLAVNVPSYFCPEEYEELNFSVSHEFPCALSLTVEDAAGVTVRRLSSRQASRPEQLEPAGSSFTWDGRLNNGDMAPEGEYRIRVRVYVGDERYECVSESFLLLSPLG